jgi:hypothetical protein
MKSYRVSASKMAELNSRIYSNVVQCAANQRTREQRRAMVEQYEKAWGTVAGEKFRQDVAQAFYQRRQAA